MERLTIRLNEVNCRCAKVSTDLCYEYNNCFDCHQYKKVVDRLAAYEDTGLEPGEIMGLCTMDKRSWMAKMLRWEEAERAGRLVVLPCKVGDTVWICGPVRGIYSAKVRTFFAGHPSLRGTSDNSMQMVRTTECDIPIKDFGKTVFLTRAEAEVTLEVALGGAGGQRGNET